MFKGQTIPHGAKQYVQVYNDRGCFQCACYMGQIQCVTYYEYKPWRFSNYLEIRQVTCHDYESCQNITLDENIVERKKPSLNWKCLPVKEVN